MDSLIRWCEQNKNKNLDQRQNCFCFLNKELESILDLVKYLPDPQSMSAPQEDQARIAAVRRFNRFYTRQIGVLRKTFLDSPYSLGEARVFYEMTSDRSSTASQIARTLGLDAGYLSRVLRNFEKRGLIERKPSSKDARQSHLTLSARGRKTFAPLEARSQRESYLLTKSATICAQTPSNGSIQRYSCA